MSPDTRSGAQRHSPGNRLAALAGKPRRTLLIAFVMLVLGAVIGSPVAGQLAGGNGFDDPNAETAQANARVLQATGVPVDSSIIVLVHAGSDVTTGPGQDLVRRVAADLRTFEQVADVIDPVSAPNPDLISTDHRSAYMVGDIRATPRNSQDVAQEIGSALHSRHPQVVVGGQLIAQQQIGSQVSRDLEFAEAFAGPVLFLVLVLVLRSVVAALLPLAVGTLSILSTFLVLRAVNSATSLSIFALNIVTGLSIGLAMDYGLLIVIRYREEALTHGYSPAALSRTLRTAGRTVLFSSLTVAAAAASLTIFPEKFLYSMGIGGVAATLISASIALTVLPALLAVLGPRIERLGWFRVERAAANRNRMGGWYRLAQAVMRRPLLVAALTAALMLALGSQFLRISYTSVDASVLPTSASARQVDDSLHADFGGDTSLPVRVVVEASTSSQATRAQVASMATSLSHLPGVRAVAPPTTLSADTWLINVLPSQPTLSPVTQDLVHAVRSVDASQPFPVLAGGQTAQFIDLQSNLHARLPLALALTVLITVVVLWVMTGSVVLPVKSVLMNALTLSAAYGLLVLIFQDGRLTGLLNFTSQGALESTQPILLYALVFGLSTDYGVMLLTRIKEGHDAGLSTTESVALGLERTGKIVTSAAILLAIALGAFATSSIVFIKEVGLGTAMAVLIDASIVRALLVPALMKMLGDWNWWSPPPLRALYQRLGLQNLERAEPEESPARA